jgi:transcriptional regulator GlxA family with amidase domain
MMKVVFLVFPDMELLDFAGPYEVFSSANLCSDVPAFDLLVLSIDGKGVRTINGVQIGVDGRWAESPDPDVLVIPGGDGARILLDEAAALKEILDIVDRSECVSSICSGARILAHFGLLDGREFTTHHSVAEEVVSATQGGRYRGDLRYVDAGRVLTSAGVTAGIDLALYLVGKSLGRAKMEMVESYIEYKKDGRV